MHANFSNEVMRTAGEESVFTKICEEFGKNIERHISVYGADNDQRLTGDHETQSIDQFSYGISDEGFDPDSGVYTYRRLGRTVGGPKNASNADPYKVAAAIVKTTRRRSPEGCSDCEGRTLMFKP